MKPASILLALAIVGCAVEDPQLAAQHCHANGYSAQMDRGNRVLCCSVMNGDQICMRPHFVTKHRRETWPQ